MDRFEAEALTHLLVVADAAVSRDWYVDVLGASVFGEYGGTSVVLDLMGNWLLLVTGGEPTPDKPTVTLAVPDDPHRVSAEIIFRVGDCQRAFEFLSTRGAEFLTTPLDRGGEIRAFFRDLDGLFSRSPSGPTPRAALAPRVMPAADPRRAGANPRKLHSHRFGDG